MNEKKYNKAKELKDKITCLEDILFDISKICGKEGKDIRGLSYINHLTACILKMLDENNFKRSIIDVINLEIKKAKIEFNNL